MKVVVVFKDGTRKAFRNVYHYNFTNGTLRIRGETGNPLNKEKMETVKIDNTIINLLEITDF